jgi:hypothetical protein
MDSSYCQTFAVSPAEPGDFPLLVNIKLSVLWLAACEIASENPKADSGLCEDVTISVDRKPRHFLPNSSFPKKLWNGS